MSWTNRMFPHPPSDFDRRVMKVIKSIPRGRVLSYSEVAIRAGKPRGARAVVAALHRLSGIPWWRVIRADGTLAREVAFRQSAHLLKEGVRLDGRRVIHSRRP